MEHHVLNWNNVSTSLTNASVHDGYECESTNLTTWNQTNDNCTNNTLEDSSVFSSGTSHLYRTIVIVTVTLVVILVGLAGNSGIVVAFIRVCELRTPVYYCFASLAVTDFLALLFCPIMPLFEIIGTGGSVPGKIACYVSMFCENVFLLCSVLTTTFITVERYIALVHPLKSRSLLTKRFTVISLASIWIASFVIALPYITSIEHNSTGWKVLEVRVWCLFIRHAKWIQNYMLAVNVVVYLIPIPAMTILTLLIIRVIMAKDDTITSSSRCGRAEEKQATQKKQTVFMLLSVLILFTICVLPFRLLQVLMTQDAEILTFETGAVVIAYLWSGRILLYLNSAGNPIVYNLVSSRFRAAFKQALGMNKHGYKSASNSDCNTESTKMQSHAV